MNNLIKKIEKIFEDFPEKWDKNQRKFCLELLLDRKSQKQLIKEMEKAKK